MAFFSRTLDAVQTVIVDGEETTPDPAAFATELASALNTLTGVDATSTVLADELTWDVTLDQDQALAPVIFDLSGVADGFDFAVEGTTNVDVSAHTRLSLVFGVDLAEQTFFVRDVALDGTVTVSGTGIDTSLRLGAAEVTLAGGEVSLTADVQASLTDIDNTDGRNRITVSDLGAAPLSTLLDVDVSGNGSATLPVNADYLAAPESLTIGFVDGLDPLSAVVGFTAGSDLEALAKLASGDFQGLMRDGLAHLPDLVDAAVAGLAGDLPMIGGGIESVAAIGQDIRDAIDTLADFNTVDELRNALQAALGDLVGIDVSDGEIGFLLQRHVGFDADLPVGIDLQSEELRVALCGGPRLFRQRACQWRCDAVAEGRGQPRSRRSECEPVRR